MLCCAVQKAEINHFLSCRTQKILWMRQHGHCKDAYSKGTAGQLFLFLPPPSAVLHDINFTQLLECLLFYICYLLFNHHKNPFAGHITPSLWLII